MVGRRPNWHWPCYYPGMILNQIFAEHKTWLQVAGAVLLPVKSVAHQSVARLKNVIKIEIPDGYQDEQGFHFGVEPAAK